MRFRYPIVLGTLLLLLIGFVTQAALSQEQSPPESQSQEPTSVLFENVQIFDGTSEQLSAPTNVLVAGNTIQTISPTSIPVPEGSLMRINGAGKGLMPGLIDAHVHLIMETTPVEQLLSPDAPVEAVFQTAEANATAMLMRRLTSARDMAGPVFELKKAIDRGNVVGPRIWPSGAMISQTAGHGDYRSLKDLPRTASSPLSRAEQYGVGALADLLLVNGNPLENIQLIEDPANNFVVIMKNGVIHKNLLG